ncbi:MAG: bifunctional precorrin-2 dehydrogenase/sirohydrochlorin ferrochelatase [Candidatus Hydrogenedentes bacterium]|nr:bifunctional precorrin-2 dehydrogenase/sirohydrochlorin ferrochelatase [Candidatus Hydrogenedentota bacterium]
MRLYPLALKVAGRRCLVVGGGRVAERKVASLLAAGARVVVVSPALCPGLDALARDSMIDAHLRGFVSGDVAGAFIVIAATDDPAVNEAVYTAAKEHGVLINTVDVPDRCDFYVPAQVNRGDLTVTVSTGGVCPALSKRLRKELDRLVSPAYEPYLELLEQLREQLQARVADPEKRKGVLEAFLDSAAFEQLEAGRPDEARRILEAHLPSATEGLGEQ